MLCSVASKDEEKTKNIAKGDNIWVFAKIKTFKNNDIDIIAQYFFDLPSDEEQDLSG